MDGECAVRYDVQDEFRMVVYGIRITAGGIDIYTGIDSEAFHDEPMSQAPYTAKQIDTRNIPSTNVHHL